MKGRECETACYYYPDCWPEDCTEDEDEDSRP